MGLMRTDRPLLIDGYTGEGSNAQDRGLPVGGGYEFRRREPSGLRPRADDPYKVWLAQREAEREQSEPTRVRWVYRHPEVTRPAAKTPVARLDVTLDEREAPDGDEGFAVLA
jgi:hypothetical protein